MALPKDIPQPDQTPKRPMTVREFWAYAFSQPEVTDTVIQGHTVEIQSDGKTVTAADRGDQKKTVNKPIDLKQPGQ